MNDAEFLEQQSKRHRSNQRVEWFTLSAVALIGLLGGIAIGVLL